MPTYFQGDAIFWVEATRIQPNPYQPRREFDEGKLKDLAESIRQYGILQPLTVTRTEKILPEGGMSVTYELIAGERRLRAAKLAGLQQVPVIIRTQAEDDSRAKLELAIIENLQREDLNPVDRARAFNQLSVEFKFKHAQIAQKIGKSREYVSNTIRILALPEEMLSALAEGKMTEGHARTLLMLEGKLEEQKTLFKEILYKKLTVREAESISRRIAFERTRRKEEFLTPDIIAIEKKLTESLGTRVQIEAGARGGKVVIDYFAPDDLQSLLDHLAGQEIPFHASSPPSALDASEVSPSVTSQGEVKGEVESGAPILEASLEHERAELLAPPIEEPLLSDGHHEVALLDDRSRDEKKDDEDLYSVKNFSV